MIISLLVALLQPEPTAPTPSGTQSQAAWVVPASLKLIQTGCAGPIDLNGLSQDGTNIKSGTAFVLCDPNKPLRGTVTGNIVGNNLRLLIDWGCVSRPWPLDCKKSIGVYQGTVNSEGRVEGVTYDQLNPDGGRAQWSSVVALTPAQP